MRSQAQQDSVRKAAALRGGDTGAAAAARVAAGPAYPIWTVHLTDGQGWTHRYFLRTVDADAARADVERDIAEEYRDRDTIRPWVAKVEPGVVTS